jgi:hypothetical protein
LKPEFFEDEKVKAISIQARFVTIGLITRADDRGRQQHLEHGILGHVFPHGDVPVKQLRRWLAEIFGVGIVKTYSVGPFSYLWFPAFWRHQKINRPSESDLPAHPEDPYAAWPIADAIKAYRREDGRDPVTDQFSESNTESLIPSRGSVPFVVGDKEGSTEKDEIDARAIFDVWRDRCGHPNAKPSPERLRAVRARIKEGATEEELLLAIEGGARAPNVSDAGQRYDDIELICRNRVKLDSFIARANARPDERTARKTSNAAAIGGLIKVATA